MSRCSDLIQYGSLAKETPDVSKLQRDSGGKIDWMRRKSNRGRSDHVCDGRAREVEDS